MPLDQEVTPGIKPGDDFYRYVNQKWLDKNPVPDDRSRWGSFSVLGEENTLRLKELLEADNKPGEHPNLVKLRQFYRAAMDEKAVEEAGLSAVQPVFGEIAELQEFHDLLAFIIRQHARGMELVWNAGLSVDDKDSRRYMGQIYQSGLGLPEREYYLEDSGQFKLVRQKYLEFLEQAFKLLSFENAARRAKNVLELETDLAKISTTAVERRDPDKNYNPYLAAQLDAEFPGLAPWSNYLDQTGFGTGREINVSQPGFLNGALELLEQRPVSAWQDYFTVHVLLPVMNKLPKAFEDLHFEFYGKVLNGAQTQEPRYRRVIGLCLRLLPEPAGQLFVSAHFDEQAKDTINRLVEHIKQAFANRIKNLDWMSDTTKEKALAKLVTFLPLLGYPDEWRDFAGLEFGKNFAANYLAVAAFEWQYDMQRLDKPVDRREWLMSPALVNAYYWSNTNGITFPAGILQPPFFDASGDFAANYGGIGVVIGHELTHGFDDQGSKFDKDGNLNSWWTEEDRQKFDAAAGRLAKMFDQFQVNGRPVNGQLTLGENIADLGGVMIALDAMREEMEQTGRPDDLDGFSPEQRFFISYARIWRQNIRPELALQFLVSDPHSPSEFRVNGIVQQVEDFYGAFGVKAGDKLYLPPQDRVRIW